MAEVPVILGVAMAERGAQGLRNWAVNFGPLTYMIKPLRDAHGNPTGDFEAACGQRSVCWKQTQTDCIAAIERELLAIRAAIPPACYHCGDVLVSERDRCERCPSECDGDREEEHCAARAEVMGAAIPEAKP